MPERSRLLGPPINIPKSNNLAAENNKIAQSVYVSESRRVAVVMRDEETVQLYQKLEENMRVYLSKIQSPSVKKLCSEALDRYALRVGVSISQDIDIYATVVTNESEDRVKYIVLPGVVYGIDYETFETDKINDCVYGLYAGLCRAGIIMNWQQFYQEDGIRNVGSLALGNILLSSMGDVIYDKPRMKLFRLVMLYVFSRFYMGDPHPLAVSRCSEYIDSIQDDESSDDKTKENMKQFLVEVIDKILARYKSSNDISSILVASGLYDKSGSIFLSNLIKLYGGFGAHYILGVADLFLPYVILMKYPTDLVRKKGRIDKDICTRIEDIIIKYVRRIKFQMVEIDRVSSK